MLKSSVRVLSGVPTLFLEDTPVAGMAYTTYFEERSHYQDFWKAGYNIFFVNASFSTAPINPATEFTPFDVGIFEDPEQPDYSEFENAVNRILANCPDAVIFPRIYICMPKWWVDSHPESTVCLPGDQKREALYSEAFRIDGGKLLGQVIRSFLEKAGVHLYENTGDVVYAGNGYVGLHAATAGEKTIKLPKSVLAMPVFGAETDGEITDTLTFSLQQYETALFALFEKA